MASRRVKPHTHFTRKEKQGGADLFLTRLPFVAEVFFFFLFLLFANGARTRTRIACTVCAVCVQHACKHSMPWLSAQARGDPRSGARTSSGGHDRDRSAVSGCSVERENYSYDRPGRERGRGRGWELSRPETISPWKFHLKMGVDFAVAASLRVCRVVSCVEPCGWCQWLFRFCPFFPTLKLFGMPLMCAPNPPQ